MLPVVVWTEPFPRGWQAAVVLLGASKTYRSFAYRKGRCVRSVARYNSLTEAQAVARILAGDNSISLWEKLYEWFWTKVMFWRITHR